MWRQENIFQDNYQPQTFQRRLLWKKQTKQNTMNENEDFMLVEWEESSFGHASPGKDVLQDAGHTDS